MTELRLSNSEMKLWRRDPRNWWLAYYMEMGPAVEDVPNSAPAIGNTYHDALAHYYSTGGDPVAFAEASIAARCAANESFTDDYEKERALVVPMLSGYVEWLADEGADIDLTITGAESTVEVPLKGSDGQPLGITLISKLDAPVFRERDGAKLALEHKTVQTLEANVGVLKSDTQCLTEHLARFLHAIEAGATPDEAYEQCHGVLYNMARKCKRTAAAKPPFYGRIDVTHNVHELRNHWKHVVAWGAEILVARDRLDAGESHHIVCPPNVTRDSTWDNPFFKIYAMIDDGSDWQEALSAMFVHRDPLQRYVGASALT